MPEQERRSARLILNERAACDERMREAVCEARARGHEVEVRVIWECGDAETFAEEASRRGFGAVIAAGGDGTINSVLNGLHGVGLERSCALGILPYGTANDFASSLGIPINDPVAALVLALEVEPTSIDAGRVGDQLFLNVASGGYAARVTTDTPAELKNVFGGLAYLLTGMANVAGLVARDTRFRGPGFAWEGEAFGFFVGNGRQAGGGFQVTPQARLDDGLLDLMILPNVPWTELLTLAGEYVSLGPSESPERIQYVQLPWIEVEAPDAIQVNLDGEPLIGTRFRFEAATGLVACLIPPGGVNDGRRA